VIGGEREDAGQIVLEVGQGLRRHAEHEVEGEAVEAGGAGVGDGALGLGAAVGAASVCRCLGESDCTPSERRLTPAARRPSSCAPRQVVGVGLDGDFDGVGGGRKLARARRR